MRALIAPLAIGALGLAMLAMALGQPAFMGTRIGPGLFAQIFAAGVLGLCALWMALAAAAPHRWVDKVSGRHSIVPGLALLAAVASFIALRPLVGLVPTCAVAALLASYGAGDRRLAAILMSAAVGAVVAFAIGVLLLPPATAMWPWSPHL